MVTVNTEEESRTKTHEAGGGGSFWRWTVFAVIFRLILIYFPGNLNLSSRPEVSTPLTSLRRLAEGYWLKQSSMSPYAGSMYHGSPLLLSVLGPLTVKRIEGHPSHILCSLVFVLADLISALLIRATGQKLQRSYRKHLTSLNLLTESTVSGTHSSGDIAALVYLWNPFTIVSCVGSSTSPIENLFTILTLYGAATGLAPLAAFGWVMATHLSLYPVVLIIPVNLSYSDSCFCFFLPYITCGRNILSFYLVILYHFAVVTGDSLVGIWSRCST
ncbi:Phosphatidylinositol glycan anchor biosynthesis class U protein [Linum perenne]